MVADVMVEKIKKVLEDRKAKNIEVIPLADKTIVTDYFVIASGTSTTQLRGMADEVIAELKKEGVTPMGVEGYDSASWILIDFLDVVVHLFQQSEREFYNLEKLWSGTAAAKRKNEAENA
ncbi:MAG: ribosome silencing factor [Clostridia bacterium]|nr:ribosome silencing factor [Clostridia bacterium]